MSTPRPMRRFFPNQERAEDFTHGNLVWLQEIIQNNDGDLVVKRTLSNKHRPLHEKYEQYELDNIRAMNNSLGVKYVGKLRRYKKHTRTGKKYTRNSKKYTRNSKKNIRTSKKRTIHK